MPPDAVNVVLAPLHIVVLPAILAVGSGFTVTVTLVLASHPFASVTTTLYIVVALGLTVMLAVLAPLLHV